MSKDLIEVSKSLPENFFAGFSRHRLSTMWTWSSRYDSAYTIFDIDQNSESIYDDIFDFGVKLVIEQCLACPHLRHSTRINHEQSEWFREFGQRPSGMLVMHPDDKVFEYESYFGKNIPKDRLLYSELIIPGNVLCFSLSTIRCLYFSDELRELCDKYVCALYYQHQANPESPVDSMYVNIRGLFSSTLDDILENVNVS